VERTIAEAGQLRFLLIVRINACLAKSELMLKQVSLINLVLLLSCGCGIRDRPHAERLNTFTGSGGSGTFIIPGSKHSHLVIGSAIPISGVTGQITLEGRTTNTFKINEENTQCNWLENDRLYGIILNNSSLWKNGLHPGDKVRFTLTLTNATVPIHLYLYYLAP
jgi:hypothetical protein